MVRQEVVFFYVFIGIENESCITLPLFLHIIIILSHINSVLLLFLHKTVPLGCLRGI